MDDDIAYLAIGSNIDPEIHIPSCIERLISHEALAFCQVSSFYESAADGRPEQPNYRNGVIAMRTSCAPDALKFDVLRPIEKSEGRVRTSDKYAPRTVDLDVVIFGDNVIESEALTLPDPAIWQYPFVTIPLLEIAPDLHIPGTRERLDASVQAGLENTLTLDAALTGIIRKGIPSG